MNISDLLEQAKQATGAKSFRELERITGIGASKFPPYRRGLMFPSDDTMLKLCAAAQVDPMPWLIWLNAERTEGEVSKVYERHLAQVTRKKPAKGDQVIAA